MFDDLTTLAATIEMEAGGEPFAGKLAVGMVIVNRTEQWRQSLLDVLFKDRQFSAWNNQSPTRLRLDTIPPAAWQEDLAAASGALFRTELGIADPSRGAVFYLNVPATKAGRGDGTLPEWCRDPADPTKLNEAKVLVVLGRHTFLCG